MDLALVESVTGAQSTQLSTSRLEMNNWVWTSDKDTHTLKYSVEIEIEMRYRSDFLLHISATHPECRSIRNQEERLRMARRVFAKEARDRILGYSSTTKHNILLPYLLSLRHSEFILDMHSVNTPGEILEGTKLKLVVDCSCQYENQDIMRGVAEHERESIEGLFNIIKEVLENYWRQAPLSIKEDLQTIIEKNQIESLQRAANRTNVKLGFVVILVATLWIISFYLQLEMNWPYTSILFGLTTTAMVAGKWAYLLINMKKTSQFIT
jgi:hypothetical protein